MRIKVVLSGLLFVGILMSGSAQASSITVEFDVNITSKQDSSYQIVPFEPLLHQYASVTFDDTLTSTDRITSTENIIMQHVRNNFGEYSQTTIVSPLEYLTNVNPLIGAPVTTSSNVSSILWYNLAPPDYSQVSFAHTVGVYTQSYSDVYEYPNSYEGESWERSLSIYSLEYLGAFDQTGLENFNFTSEMLLSHFINMRDTGGVFSYVDGYNYSNRPSLLSSGFQWEGTATITNIIGLSTTPVPEPSTMLLFGTGLAGLAGISLRRKRSSSNTR